VLARAVNRHTHTDYWNLAPVWVRLKTHSNSEVVCGFSRLGLSASQVGKMTVAM